MSEMTPATRRSVIGYIPIGAALGMAAVAGTANPAMAQAAPRTFVLVHGAYEGGWIWRYTVDLLLAQEPFVAGVDTMIDRVVADIPDAEHGFTMIFSSTPFPGHQYCLDWRRAEGGGNWYYAGQLDMEGWLCPALFRYFQEAPKQLYVQTKSR